MLTWETTVTFVIRSFSKIERAVFFVFALLMTTSVLGMLWYINQAFLVPVPAHGGTLVEGAIRSPVLINPLFANSERASEVDRDLTALIYSGLLRANPDGTLDPDLANRYDVSQDGLTYTFFLKDNIYWHDGEPITAEDVVFTIAKAQDSILKSPKRASWDGIIVEEVSARTVRFILENPYPPFLENMTLGILPKHIWASIDSSQFEYNRYNREPIGSGPYKLSKIIRDANDIPLSYNLVAFDAFALGKPYIDNINVRFYGNEESLLKALQSGEIQSTVYITPETAQNLSTIGFRVDKAPLLHIFGVFFNQNQKSYFADKVVRTALHDTLDKERIINEVFRGYATPIDGPLPPGALGYAPYQASNKTFEERIADAQALLIKDGWKYDDEKHVMIKKVKNVTQELSFSISTISPTVIPALKSAAVIIKENWEQLGARVDVKVFETKGDLSQNAIRPRKYDALLFGEVIGRDSDPFAFWHSSQRLDPGLNIALYANIKADKALEKGRELSDPDIRAETYATFRDMVSDDVPAVFIYSPDLTYVLPKNIKGVAIGHVVTPSERFIAVHTWYLEKAQVWKMYAK
ncbi:MAG: ABC transporter substrate-binding protein [bacterium]|nr:ABC transporter substrate-binding protein [bacterium]